MGPKPKALPFARAAIVGPRLEALLAVSDPKARIVRDPVELVHRYERPDDRELVAMLASAVAYGRVDLFKPRLAKLLEALGPAPAAFARAATPRQVLEAVAGFSYRMTGPGEIGALLYATGRLQREHGSVGRLAELELGRTGDWREALAKVVGELWAFDLKPFVGQRGPTRRLAHLVASPAGASACKRLNLFARWMVRGPDGVDLAQWRVPTSVLVMPLDTHVHRISRFVGLTRRRDLSWRTAEEITARLRHLDPVDPVRFDFALSHLGISGECPSRRDHVKCARCPLQPVCRVWDRHRSVL